MLQGTTPHIENSTELEQLVDKLRADADMEECLMMWTAYSDRELNELIVNQIPKYCDSNPQIWKIINQTEHHHQGNRRGVHQPWRQFQGKFPPMAGMFFPNIFHICIFVVNWETEWPIMIPIKMMLMLDNDNQDGQPDGNELESGVAIHTLRMPMPYRCPHTELQNVKWFTRRKHLN